MARHIIPLTIHVVAYVMYGDGEADAAEEALLVYKDREAEVDGVRMRRCVQALRPELRQALAALVAAWLLEYDIVAVARVE